MKYLFLFSSYLFASIFLFLGIGFLFVFSPLGILWIIVSALFTPPILSRIQNQISIKLDLKKRALFVVVSFVATTITLGLASDATSNLDIEAAKKKTIQIEEFTRNKSDIILNIEALIIAENFSIAVDEAQKYAFTSDEDIIKLQNRAQSLHEELLTQNRVESLLEKIEGLPEFEYDQRLALYAKLAVLQPESIEHKERVSFYKKERLKAQRKDEKEKIDKSIEETLKKLKTVPQEQYILNRNLYQKLTVLDTENSKYREKLAFYNQKILEKEKQDAEKKKRQERIERQFSGWSGSHRNLEKIVLEYMNDPDSYEHDKTVYWDMGDYLIVTTNYRGRNGFGGMVRGFVKAKISLDGQVLKILDEG